MNRTITPQALKNALADRYILDARRASDRDASDEQLPGAHWHDPDKLSEWVGQLPRDQDIVLYCARGGSVSNSVVDALQARGLRACFIEGGIEGWKTAGGQTLPK
jgi:rhodanese-related sulfurtransferase